MKRSVFGDRNLWDYTSDWYYKGCTICYWAPDRKGYTFNINEAGIYTLNEINHICGSDLDWFIAPVYLEEEE